MKSSDSCVFPGKVADCCAHGRKDEEEDIEKQ